MSEIEETPRGSSGVVLGVTIAALVLALGGLLWSYTLGGRIAAQQAQLADAQQQNVKLAAELRETDARLRVATEALGKSLGLTQQQMDSRAEEMVRREQENEQRAQQMEATQKQTAQQIKAVSGEVSNVKTDVGGVKSDVARTRNDLNAAVTQLSSMRGDLSDHASLIARNHDELEVLKHRGDRNYYEFSLTKGQRKVVGSIALELKKADMKKSRFTVEVYSDDRKYEKKDRNVNEPLQFYSGRTPMLFEIVVNNIQSKNQISGYLAAPKNGSTGQ